MQHIVLYDPVYKDRKRILAYNNAVVQVYIII